MPSASSRQIIRTAAMYGIMFLALAPFMFPLYWLVTGVFKEPGTILQVPPDWWPSKWTLTNFDSLFSTQGSNLATYAKNTLYICLFTTVATVCSSALPAYAFSCIDFRGRNLLFWSVIITLILPPWATIVPQYQLFKWLGWLGSLNPLTLPTLLGDPFTIFLLRQYMLSIPRDIGEAARVDGAGEFRIFFRIMVPLIKPALAVAAVFAAVNSYNNFFAPLIYLTDPNNYTLSLGVYQFIQLHGTPNMAAIIAYTVIVVMPLVALFAVTQRWVVSGIRMSSWT